MIFFIFKNKSLNTLGVNFRFHIFSQNGIKMSPAHGLSIEFQWVELFLQTLTYLINTTEKTIDKMVYEPYGLSEEKIDIIENS